MGLGRGAPALRHRQEPHRAAGGGGHAPDRAVHRRGSPRHREGPGFFDAAGRAGRHPARTTDPAMRTRALAGVLAAAVLLGGCALETSAPPSKRTDAPSAPPAQKPTASQKTVDPAQVERLKKAMVP